MKFITKMLGAAALATLATQPVLAADAAQKLSVAKSVRADARSSAQPGKSKALAGLPLILIIGAVAVVTVVAVATGDDSPDSP